MTQTERWTIQLYHEKWSGLTPLTGKNWDSRRKYDQWIGLIKGQFAGNYFNIRVSCGVVTLRHIRHMQQISTVCIYIYISLYIRVPIGGFLKWQIPNGPWVLFKTKMVKF
jgi:hypothetical protein